MKPTAFRTAASLAALTMLFSASRAAGQLPPQGDPIASRAYGIPELAIVNVQQPPSKLPADIAGRLRTQLTALGIPDLFAAYDLRGGHWGTLSPSRPLVPGSGAGNTLTWAALGIAPPSGDAAYKQAAWEAFKGWLDANRATLGIDTAELGPASIGSYEGGRLVHLFANRVVNGVTVRMSFVQATINSGNLILYGNQNWGPIDVSTKPAVTSQAAQSAVTSHLSGLTIAGWGRSELVLIPTASGDATAGNEGRGYHYRLAWAVTPQVKTSQGSWEALVDAQNLQLLAFYDRNSYLDQRKVIGGIFPVSNDGQSPGGVPDGIEQPNFPMGHAYVFDAQGNQLTANAEGLVSVNGPISTALTGPFIRIQENCGNIDEHSACAALDLATSAGTDCAVPDGHSVGDTHSARTGFYELNRLIDQAKSWLGPTANANLPTGWLNRQLPANMDINNSCNAFFSPTDTGEPTTGSVNFYRQSPNGGPCRNTGEIAAVFDHEWGHGLDTFDNSAGVSLPGEAYADMTAIHRLNTSCIGRGFFVSGFCGGNGDPCTQCSGVREADWTLRQSGKPHDIDWIMNQNPTVPGGCGAQIVPPTPFNAGPCLRGTHCEGSVVTEAVWDLLKRDLRCHGLGWEVYAGGAVDGGRCTNGQPPTMSENSALVLGTRLFYLAGGGITMGYQCDPTVGGCVAGSWYLNYLAADDDDGTLADGTPHMVAIHDAFLRHELACDAPVPINFGCVATPAPAGISTVTATAGVRSATVTWTPVAGAGSYWVLRTDGVHGCTFGKTRVAQIPATSPLTLTQTDLLDGLTYYYSVVAVGGTLGVGADACAGPMSDCAAVTPLSPNVAGEASAAVVQTNQAVVEPGGDNDAFVDNCETASLTFDVVNTGGSALTNLRVTAIQPSLAQTQILTPLPIALPAIQGTCGSPGASTPATFRFQLQGAPPQSTLTFNVTVMANELSAPVTGTLTVNDVETDLVLGDVLFDFENGTQGWEAVSGTFDRTNIPPGAEGTSFCMKSSSGVDNACDRARSPKMRLTSSSTLSLFNQYETEAEADPDAGLPFYDRANVGIINEQGQRTIINPDGGRLYNALNTYSGCNNGPGWATSVDQPVNLFAQSNWSASALGAASYAGQQVQIEVSYGTDALNSHTGLQFDQVRLTNVLIGVPDAQSNTCNRPPDAVDDTATTPKNTPVTINVLANDNDPDGDPLTVTSVSDPPHGTAARNADNTVTYTPDTDFTGNDSFTYAISDGRGGTDTATVSVTVTQPMACNAGKASGGGEISVTGGTANFGFNMKRDSGGTVSGQLEYQNHASGVNVHSVSMASVCVDTNRATFTGSCGSNCTFRVSVVDNGEPGDTDEFTISVNGGSLEGGRIARGNIQVR